MTEPTTREHTTREHTARQHTVLVAHPGAELYGSDRVLLESVSALAESGWGVVVTIPSDGPLHSELRSRGANVRTCRSPVLRKSALRPVGMLRLLASTVAGTVSGLQLLRRVRPGLVYVNTMTIPLWVVLARLRGIPVLCHVHEAESSAPKWVRWAMALPLLGAKVIIANSRFSVDVLTGSLPRLADRTRIVYNGVAGPPRRTRPRTAIHGPVRVTFVGRLSPRKGTDIAIEAIAQLRERGLDAELRIAGAVFPGYEWFEEHLRSLVDRYQLGEKVHFLGFVNPVWDVVADSDVLVVPSRVDEPFGDTAVEAILSGRPVIASATSGLLEATAGYATATTVRPGSASALADALERVARGWAPDASVSDRDLELALARHSPDSYRRRISAVADSLSDTRERIRERNTG